MIYHWVSDDWELFGSLSKWFIISHHWPVRLLSMWVSRLLLIAKLIEALKPDLRDDLLWSFFNLKRGILLVLFSIERFRKVMFTLLTLRLRCTGSSLCIWSGFFWHKVIWIFQFVVGGLKFYSLVVLPNSSNLTQFFFQFFNIFISSVSWLKFTDRRSSRSLRSLVIINSRNWFLFQIIVKWFSFEIPVMIAPTFNYVTLFLFWEKW